MSTGRRSSLADRRESLSNSYEHGSIGAARGNVGGALEAVVLTNHGATFETDAELEEFYKPIPSYEGYHRYDPGFQWEEPEEKKVVRKVGRTLLRILPS